MLFIRDKLSSLWGRHVAPPARRRASLKVSEGTMHRVSSPVLLPPQQGPQRKTLVLDLDRTLIDCIMLREAADSEADFIYTDELGTRAKVWVRPFLRQFLEAVSRDFEVVLFTAAGPRHADSVLAVIDPHNQYFSHRLYGHHTTESSCWGYVKDLSRLGRPLHHTLLVDDSQLAALRQPCNLVPVRPFVHNDPKKDWDTALTQLLKFLQHKVLPASDVRVAIATHWNKITRQPRKAPLRSHTAHPCNCSCHAIATASMPLQAAAALNLQAQTGQFAGQQRGARLQQPQREHQCAAVNAGCGCGYDDETSAAVAALMLQLHTLHDDEEALDGPCACTCCELGAAVPHAASGAAVSDSHTSSGNKSCHNHQPQLRRSPTDRQLSSRDSTPRATQGGSSGSAGGSVHARQQPFSFSTLDEEDPSSAACSSRGTPVFGGHMTAYEVMVAVGRCSMDDATTASSDLPSITGRSSSVPTIPASSTDESASRAAPSSQLCWSLSCGPHECAALFHQQEREGGDLTDGYWYHGTSSNSTCSGHKLGTSQEPPAPLRAMRAVMGSGDGCSSSSAATRSNRSSLADLELPVLAIAGDGVCCDDMSPSQRASLNRQRLCTAGVGLDFQGLLHWQDAGVPDALSSDMLQQMECTVRGRKQQQQLGAASRAGLLHASAGGSRAAAGHVVP